MGFHWLTFVHLGIIAAALVLATWIRARVPFFQRYLVPNSLTAGFLLLFFYNFLARFLRLDSALLGELIYHLLSISFIAMSLRDPPSKKTGRRVFAMGLMIAASFTLQALLGLGLAFLLIATFMPALNPSIGLFIPLGYEMGPGQAYSIGKGWEDLGFAGAGSLGLTFAALGFLWACFGGVYLVNLGIRRGWVAAPRLGRDARKGMGSGVLPPGSRLPVGSLLTTETEALDGLALNLAAVLVCYLATFLLLKGLTALVSLAGKEGRELAVNLWGISFIFAALLAALAKMLARRARVDHLLDPGSLTRIAGLSVDLLVAASLGAISLVVVARYWGAILLMSLAAGVLTAGYCLWLSCRLFDEHRFQRALIFYGGATGTLPTGLALLRVVDPAFETPAAVDYMYGSGVAFFLVIPYVLAINLPMYGYMRGQPRYYWLIIGLLLAYLVVILILVRVLGGKKAYAHPLRLWVEEPREPGPAGRRS
jgi:ESS family glutamate:Na+ symporter